MMVAPSARTKQLHSPWPLSWQTATILRGVSAGACVHGAEVKAKAGRGEEHEMTLLHHRSDRFKI